MKIRAAACRHAGEAAILDARVHGEQNEWEKMKIIIIVEIVLDLGFTFLFLFP